MRKRLFTIVAIAALVMSSVGGLLPLRSATAGEEAVHKVAVHVDENDPARIKLALNNVENIKKYYDSIGEAVKIEVVAYGPGLHMLREDTSPAKERIAALSLEIETLVFSACGNTHSAMSKKAGKAVPLLSEARMVPSGVVQLIALQEQGYAYVRP